MIEWSDPFLPVYSAEVKGRHRRPRQSPRTHLVLARCCQRVNLTTGLPKIRHGWNLACLTIHAVRRVDNIRRGAGAMIRAQA